MITKEYKTERTCLFYASEYHLEMILLPYIRNKMNKKKIIIFTETNLEKTLDILLTRINLKEEEKEKIKNINWKNEDKVKFEELENTKEACAIIKGSLKYIEQINKKIKNCRNIEVIDCFYIEEKDIDIVDIKGKYRNVLNTQKIN